MTVGYIVRRLSTVRYLAAVLRRVRLMGQPVLSEHRCSATQFHRRPMSHCGKSIHSIGKLCSAPGIVVEHAAQDVAPLDRTISRRASH